MLRLVSFRHYQECVKVKGTLERPEEHLLIFHKSKKENVRRGSTENVRRGSTENVRRGSRDSRLDITGKLIYEEWKESIGRLDVL